MASVVQFLVIIAAISTVYGQEYTVTTGTDDYLTISQKSLLHKIQLAEAKTVAVDNRYSDRIDTIELDQQQALNLILQVNQTLTTLQVLSLVRKHCIQKFAPQQPNYNTYKVRFDTCNNKARSSGLILTSTARTSASFARSYTITTMPRNAAGCSTYKYNQTRYELCYEESVQQSTEYVDAYITQIDEQLEKSLFDANTYTRTAVQCSFAVQEEILNQLSSTSKLIDNCEDELNKNNNLQTVQSSIEPKTVKNLIVGKVNGL